MTFLKIHGQRNYLC